MIVTHPGNFEKYAYLALNTVNETGGGGKYLWQSAKWKKTGCFADVFAAESWLSALFPLFEHGAPAKVQRLTSLLWALKHHGQLLSHDYLCGHVVHTSCLKESQLLT